jgi:dolichol-phosphate mannosyltransferase
MSPQSEAPEALLSRATVEGPAAPLPTQRRRAWASLRSSLRSVRNWQELGKFCVVGAVGYLINLGVYDVLLHAHVHYLVAATCSFFVAVTSNYTWNRLWTFREHRGHLGIQGMRFLIVSLAALGANLVVLHLLIAYGDLDKLPAQAVAIVAVTPLNFVGNKLWSFRRAAAE